jgi:hypothetical protein
MLADIYKSEESIGGLPIKINTIIKKREFTHELSGLWASQDSIAHPLHKSLTY